MAEKKDPNAERVNIMYAPVNLDYRFTASDHTSRFLDSIKNGQFIGSQVSEGSPVYVPPRPVCPETGLPAEKLVEMPDTGKIQSFTIVHIPIPDNPIKPPFVVANIQLDGAAITFLHLISGCDNDEIEIDMRVKAVWKPEAERSHSPANIHFFAPIDKADELTEQMAKEA
ncbi:MAG: Zn-ribbon domain-containing OB-fold protein [Pseudomonadales bacterium]